MHLNAMAIWVIQEHLVPTGDSPAAIVRVLDAQFITAAHEPLDVIGSETEMTVTHGVHILLHLEPGFQVTFGPMEFNVTVGQEVHFPCVRTVFPDTAHHRVFLVSNRSQIKKCPVELGHARQVVGANVHVMKLEIHR